MVWLFAGLMFAWTLSVKFIMKQKISSPAVIFGTVWSLIFVFSGLRLFGMIEYSDEATGIMGVGASAFMLGCTGTLAWNKRKNRLKEKANENSDRNLEQEFKGSINYRIVYILLVIGIIVLIPVAIKVTSLLFEGVSYEKIRSMFYSYGDSKSLLPNEQLFTLFDWYTLSVIAATTSLLVVDIVTKKRIKKMAVILFTVFVVLFVYATAGRMRLIVIILDVVLTASIYGLKLNKKVRKFSVRAGIVLLAIFAIMSFGRSGKNNERIFIGQRAYYYMALPMPYFSKIVNYVDENQVYTNGAATFYGPYLLIQKSAKLVTGYKFSEAEVLDKEVNKPQSYWVKAYNQSKNYFNAFASMFYNFYLDFRWVGVIVFGLLYGIGVEWFYLDMLRRRTVARVAIYLIIALGLVMSFAHWQLASPDVLIAFLIIFICTRQKKKIYEQHETTD